MAGQVAATPRLVARGLRKTFGSTRALVDVSFSVVPGSIHAILGENGAGKSTLMNIVAGALRPDAGTLTLDGQPYLPEGPLSARQHGVAIVYQELSVCPDLSVAENIVLGMEPHRYGWISERRQADRVRRALEPIRGADRRFGPETKLAALSAADRQLVEIARAFAAENTRLLILDEPTSSLAHHDVERLFQTLQVLRDRGVAILYISHFLEEVRRIADQYTLLRDGSAVSSGRVSETTNEQLAFGMSGRAVEVNERRLRAAGEPLLSLSALGGALLPVSVDLTLCRGEVLGIAGLVGSGRTELLRAVFGLDAVRRGQVRVGAFVGPASPAKRLAQGVGLLSEDRKSEGLALDLSVAENLTLSKLRPLVRFGFILPRLERAATQRWTERLNIRCREPFQRVSELSGGNQQKVALARLLYHDVDVLLLDEPTRGIDVQSRSAVHRLIDEACEQGKAVLLVSSQLPELLAISDRIAVMHRGVLGTARPAAELVEHTLLLEAAGA